MSKKTNVKDSDTFKSLKKENVVYQGDTELPPAGYKRDDELARRADHLAEVAENQPEQYSIDPSKMEVDREIRYDIEDGMLNVPHAQPGYVYRWVQNMYPSNDPGREVNQSLVKNVVMHTPHGKQKVPVWEVVTKGMPEAEGMRINASNAVFVGDTILMRCRKDIHVLVENERRKRNHVRNLSTDASLVAVADDLKLHGYDTDAGHAAYNKHYRNANQTIQASQAELDHQLKSGSLPGFEMPNR